MTEISRPLVEEIKWCGFYDNVIVNRPSHRTYKRTCIDIRVPDTSRPINNDHKYHWDPLDEVDV